MLTPEQRACESATIGQNRKLPEKTGNGVHWAKRVIAGNSG
jgi:hypothetical protein